MNQEYMFKVNDVCKNFGETKALKGVSMNVRPGEVVGLVGENGAGKSTLLKIIMGVHAPTSGTMEINGTEFAPKNPREANHHGVGMVFQEQSLIINLTVGQNIFFGQEKRFSTGGLINYSKMYENARKVLAEVGLSSIKPETYVRELPFAARQMVEIAKVINQAYSSSIEHALILLDEPTSVLNDEELHQLYKQMRDLVAKGHSIIFVSHRLEEILEISDRIFVFKDAENAGEFDNSKKDITTDVLYSAMVGKGDIGEFYKTAQQIHPEKEVVLEVKNLSSFGRFRDVSFKLHRGEILGFCGVVGSGKEDVFYALTGDICPSAGKIYIKGKPKKLNNPSVALDNGIIMIPQERNIEGIFGVLSVADNICASDLKRIRKFGIVSGKKIASLAKSWIEKLQVRTPSHRTEIRNLSGGNAQKVVFARALASDTSVLILNHPTRGVDIGVKFQIYQIVRDLVKEGRSIILLGDTLDECIGLSNRVLVMKDGIITGEFNAAADNKPSNLDIVKCMM